MTKDNIVRFTFRLPNDLYKKVASKSEEIGVSKNAFLINIIDDLLSSEEKKYKKFEDLFEQNS